MLLGILLFFVFVGVLFLFLAGDDEPVIEKPKQKTGYYDHNNKYYDSFDAYLRERNAEIEKEREREREKIRRDSESRYQSSYEKWRTDYQSSRHESEYEKWKRERYKREEDKSDINNKVDKLFNLIVKDFSNNPYHDKIQSLGSSYSIISFNYKFENGFRFTLNDKDIRVYNRDGENISSYRLGDSYHLKFLKLILEIKQKAQHRSNNYRTYTEYDFNSKFNDYKKEYKKEQPKEEPKVKTTGNPRLDKINEKIVLREEQLRKMKSNDPERQALVNELETYKNVAKKMKSKIK